MLWDRPGPAKLLDVALHRRIGVVVSVAGWGKTTALRSWTRRHRSVWLRPAGRRDAWWIIRALQVAGEPDIPRCPVELSLSGNDADRVAAAAMEVCEWLRTVARDELFVVVDDVEWLPPHSDAARFIEGLCWHAPEQVHLVLLSRREPPFSLTRLRGQGLLADVTAAQLAFDISDVELLLEDVVGSAASDLAELVLVRTDGWPAAVAAVVEALAGVEAVEYGPVVERLAHTGERFHNYLREEVVGREPEEVQDFLRRAAVLGEITVIAGLGVSVPDPEAVLVDLTRRGLLRNVPGERGCWRLIRPLADYFAQESVLRPAERAALHAAAAGEFAERGAYAEALQHLLAAGAGERAASLLADHGEALVSSGAADVVLQTAELVPEQMDDERLQQVLGEARQVRGLWAEAFDAFQRAGHGQERLQPSLAWRIALMLQMQGEFGEIPPILDQVVIGREDTFDVACLLAQVASAHRLLGDFPNAYKLANRSMAAARRSGHASASGPAHNVLATLAAAEGDRRRVDAHFDSALRDAEANHDLLHALWTRTSRVFNALDTSPREAAREARALRELTEAEQVPFLTAHLLTVSARADVRLGSLDSAAADLTVAIDHFQRLASRFLAWPLTSLGDLYRVKGQLARARAAYEEALELAESARDAIGLASALAGLARVRAADDLAVAGRLADRAVAVGEPLRQVEAYLARGWVALLAGDRQSASIDAARAGAAARRRRDDPGLAEAITLTVLSFDTPEAQAELLDEAVQILQEAGCRLDEAAVRMVAGRIGGPAARLHAERAAQTLQAAGVDVEGRRAAGPLAALTRAVPTGAICTLGVFQVVRDGEPVPKSAWQSKKARDLVKILVARRRPTAREHLSALLWPDADPTRSANRLSVLLSMARDVLQPGRAEGGPLMSDGTTVWLDHSRITVDVEEFLQRADIALKAYRSGQLDAAELLTAALAAYTGGFLEDDPYEDWAVPLAEEVRAIYMALLRARISTLHASGEVDEVIRHALRLLEEDPYDEDVRLDLVDALQNAGRLGEARRHYEVYAKRMQEIDVEPQPMPQSGRRRKPSAG
ncbi:MAG TPA: BTAD domain-containing putative transcriptional regulator [Blastococcus sp.]